MKPDFAGTVEPDAVDKLVEAAKPKTFKTFEDYRQAVIDTLAAEGPGKAVGDLRLTGDYQLQSTLKKVITGVIYNETDDVAVSDVIVLPLSTNPSIALLDGDLAAGKSYLVLLIGTDN